MDARLSYSVRHVVEDVMLGEDETTKRKKRDGDRQQIRDEETKGKKKVKRREKERKKTINVSKRHHSLPRHKTASHLLQLVHQCDRQESRRTLRSRRRSRESRQPQIQGQGGTRQREGRMVESRSHEVLHGRTHEEILLHLGSPCL